MLLCVEQNEFHRNIIWIADSLDVSAQLILVLCGDRSAVKCSDALSCSDKLQCVFRCASRLFVCPDDVLQRHVLVAETNRVLLHLHVNRILRTVMKAGITDLAAVEKSHLFSHSDVICGADFGTDTAAGAAVVYGIVQHRILS